MEDDPGRAPGPPWAEPSGIRLTQRAVDQLPQAREDFSSRVDPEASVVITEEGRTRWWTWAGGRANALLIAMLEFQDPLLIDSDYIFDNRQITLRKGVDEQELGRALTAIRLSDDAILDATPYVGERALSNLSFRICYRPS